MLKDAWTLAIEALSWMEKDKINEQLALARTAKQLRIGKIESLRLAHKLIFETVRHLNIIDRFINEQLKPESISTFPLGVQAFLRLYVYQTRVSKGWVNLDVEEAEKIVRLGRAILGWKTLEDVEPILGMLLTGNPKGILKKVSDEERVGLLTFHPTWFVRYCFKLFGRKDAIELLKANLKTPSTYIRLNTLKESEETILEEIAEDGIKVEKVNGLKYAYKVLYSKTPLVRTKSFKKGLFYIQDKASCFAAESIDPKPGAVVLDVCAAPGAKTTYLAQLMQNRGVIYSIDYSRRRMNVWRREMARMGVEIAEPIIADACNHLPFAIEADIVVLDPPCTSTGTFARLPSAKWRLTPRSIYKMAEIQWQMLEKAAEKVKQKGILFYSTCSITVEENEMLVERFLKWHPEFRLEEIKQDIGVPGFRRMKKCRRLFPHIHDCNGFFMAKMIKS
ncbi:RsmB/NOP family class I SAM-dependent RNA methyltransferase [Candidatus Bathyarchaeota archaeon]|nr:RsmB/NOP family class I SAM-dependent RNA methyltransferase [Candidatus Bathyarchaeota archaeon]